MTDTPLNAGASWMIPSGALLEDFNDPEYRDIFVSEHVRTRLALLIRALREQRGWSQAEMGRRLGKPQSVVARLENPDYRVSLQTVFEVAAAFGLPVYIDMPEWDEWFRLMGKLSERDLQRRSFDPTQLQNQSPSPATTAIGTFYCDAGHFDVSTYFHASDNVTRGTAMGSAGFQAAGASLGINSATVLNGYEPSEATQQQGTMIVVGQVGGSITINTTSGPITIGTATNSSGEYPVIGSVANVG